MIPVLYISIVLTGVERLIGVAVNLYSLFKASCYVSSLLVCPHTKEP